jgi:hypothetical protein
MWKRDSEAHKASVAKAAGQTLLKLIEKPKMEEPVAYFMGAHWTEGLRLKETFDEWVLEEAFKRGVQAPPKNQLISWRRQYAERRMLENPELAQATKDKQQEEFELKEQMYLGCVGESDMPATQLSPQARFE